MNAQEKKFVRQSFNLGMTPWQCWEDASANGYRLRMVEIEHAFRSFSWDIFSINPEGEGA